MMKLFDVPIFDTLPTHVQQISFTVARRIIEQNHYLGYAPCGCKFCLGVFADAELMGVMIFGRPIARLEDQNGTLELTRMFLYDSPKNSESRALGLAEKWIKKNRVESRLIAYSDTAQGHNGTIYRAANWQEISRVRAGTWIRKNRLDRRGIIGGDKIKFERNISRRASHRPCHI
ncbi:MAG: hypothetical protein J7K40_12145 [candidate division Zixibacteria bacterium]|nr:hypothetical protein [candidate division Zixibacteria bacterium]